MRYMSPIKDRKRLGLGVVKKIRSRIEYLARINDCSMNFVSNTLLARQLGIDIGEAYDDREAARKSTAEAGRNRRGNLRDTPVSSKYSH